MKIWKILILPMFDLYEENIWLDVRAIFLFSIYGINKVAFTDT